MANIWKRKDRRWTVDYRDAWGQRRRLSASSREEAEQLLANKVRESSQAARPVRDADITVEVYAKKWLDQVSTSIAPRTLQNYRQQLRVHVLPAFGRMKLRSLHRGHIKELLREKRDQGLSKNSVRHIRATCSVM